MGAAVCCLTVRFLQTKQKAGQPGRTGVKCVKRKPNKAGGGGDKVDLLVLIDLVRHSHNQPGPLSLVKECRGLALIGRELQSVEIFS